MKNKFEALNAFQQWPEDWQRLCAEYWAENVVSDKPSNPAPVPAEECFTVGKYTPRQEEYLVKCCHENRHKNGKVNRKKAALQFLAKYPGRVEESVREKARVLENRNWKINY